MKIQWQRKKKFALNIDRASSFLSLSTDSKSIYDLGLNI